MTLLESFRYYEYILIDFYNAHYFLLVAIIVGGLTLIFLIPFGFAIYKADKEPEVEKRKLTAKSKYVLMVDTITSMSHQFCRCTVSDYQNLSKYLNVCD